MNTLITLATEIAIEAHAGQTDKAGKPYILHPLAVGRALRNEDIELEAAGILHDVIEDTAFDAVALAARGIPAGVIRIVLAVSRREGETYAAFIARVRESGYEAVAVKKADLMHNLTRVGYLAPKERESLRKRYTRALAYLRGETTEF